MAEKENSTLVNEQDEKTEAQMSGNEDKVEQSGENGSIMDIDGTEEIKGLQRKLQDKENEIRDYIDLSQRVKAEFDNFKKRTLREKEQLYVDTAGDIIIKLLPVIDNLERAISSASAENSGTLVEGVNMILKQFKDVLAKEGVEEISAQGEQFDPNYHNAVMHVEDESVESNVVMEVLQKGYMLKGKVLRHSLVKVAN